MRIAMIGQKGIPAHYGGVERHVHDLSLYLVKVGHEVTVYSRPWYAGRSVEHVQDVLVQHVPTIHTKHLDTVTHVLLSTIHALFQGFDVMHYHGVGPALFSWIPRIFSPKTKVITTFHSIDRYHQKWGPVAKLVLRLGEWAACVFAHETVTVSQSLQQYCLNEFNTETVYIPNGVDCGEIDTDATILHEFGLEKGKYLVMVSRLVPHKGAHILIEAFKRLKDEERDNPRVRDVKLVIVGGSVHTDSYVEQLYFQAALTPDIVFTGFQSGAALNGLYQNALALVHPSFNEGLPLTVLQAMGHARPVLVSSIPEHLELIDDPRVIFKENHVRALEEKFRSFLELEKSEHDAMGARNRAIVESTYNWKVLVLKIVALYEKGEETREMKELSHKLA